MNTEITRPGADDPYQVLGLELGAAPEQIRHAYFRLVRQFTPETHPEEFKRIREAYDILRSPARRAELALLSFDTTVAEFDLDIVAAADDRDFEVADVLLAVELRASDLARSEFPADLTPVDEEELRRA